MGFYVLTYEVVEDYAERRTQYRQEHLGLAKEAHDRGELVIAGAAGDPIDCAILVFRTGDPSVAESFAQNDPYVVNGLVTAWQVRPWNVVIGQDSFD